ncbi:MAG: vWA domain-containing protein, partial [Streptosporangiaceae bacterium]
MPHLAAWERDQEQAQVFVRAVAFATEPRWHIPHPTPVTQISWKPLEPVYKGLTNMGPAFALVGEALEAGRIERRALRPALLLITDGLATDPPGEFESGLESLMARSAGRAALRLAVAIGQDARSEALNQFIGDPSVPVLVADNTEEIADRLVAASLAVSHMSEVGADRGGVARRLGTSDGMTTGIFSQDTIV